MKRIYIDFQPSAEFIIDGATHHYLKNVLRMTAGERISILTPSELLEAEFISLDKRRAELRVDTRQPVQRPDYRLTVCQCLLKREYMDTVVEKLTELGVTEIIPIISIRSLPSLKDNSLSRFQEIAKAAALQSEQLFLPTIREAVRLSDISAMADADNLLFYERGEFSTPSLKYRNAQLVIGPEGGFTDDEVALLQTKGFSVCTPMNSILKAETAAAVFTGYVRIHL